MDVRIGDWAHFYQNSKLVIGVVHYIRAKASWERYPKACTDVGEVPTDQILEVRSPKAMSE